MTKSSVNWSSQSAQVADYLHHAYAELERAAPGAPIDLTAAFGDLIDLKRGGQAALPGLKRAASAGTALW